jgi:hypothetical protein
MKETHSQHSCIIKIIEVSIILMNSLILLNYLLSFSFLTTKNLKDILRLFEYPITIIRFDGACLNIY